MKIYFKHFSFSTVYFQFSFAKEDNLIWFYFKTVSNNKYHFLSLFFRLES